MNYAKWKDIEELKKELTRVDKKLDIQMSGDPLVYDDENLYIDDKDGHTLVIGTTGSGKTQTMVLPQIKLAMYAGENIVVKDNNGELYETLAKNLEEKGYQVYAIDFDEPELGNNWNPLWLPYKLYKDGKEDDAQRQLEKIGHYLFHQMNKQGIDDFWTNAAKQYFVGISLYLFKKGEETEINLNSVYNITSVGEDKKDDKTYFEHIINGLDRMSPEYINLSGTICAPTETRGGILSVFRQVIKMFVSRQTLSNMLASNDIDLNKMITDKIAIFMIGDVNGYTVRLEPLFIDQLYSCLLKTKRNEKRINIILDDFENMCPLDNFNALLNSARSLNMKFSLIVKSLMDLERNYGKESADILKYTMARIIYLLANDFYTIEEVCRLCGNKEANVPLITPEELKVLNVFEAVVLIPRMMPIRTKLLPDYNIPWELQKDKKELQKKKKEKYSLFDLKKHI